MIGRMLGPYRIVAKLGEGGMGAVYRARDTKLNRDVAIKVLLPAVAADPDRLARFRREAQLLAALNHPNIAALYGLDEGGESALVMELVEGPTLADRLAHGAMPLEEALPVARQIAGALEAAHEHGIVHRDLKPANIKVRDDGTVKVLDFGLAKAIEPAGSPTANVSMSPTVSGHATQAGVVLGTAAYMSPEQARGRAVDKRADIWAFGVVLYEMLTGRRAFTGDHVSERLASVLKDTPDFAALPPHTPPSIRRFLQRCLERDPRQRLRDIGDVRLELDDLASGRQPPAAGTTLPVSSATTWSASRVVLAVGCASVAAAIGLTAGWLLARQGAGAPPSIVRLNIPPPAGREIHSQTISPDGRFVVFAADRLYLREISQFASRPFRIPVKGSSLNRLWSPDGRTLTFSSVRKGDFDVFRTDLDGANEQELLTDDFDQLAWGWTRDGRRLVVSELHPDGSRFVTVIAPGSGGTREVLACSQLIPDFPIVHLATWQRGAWLGLDDAALLMSCAEAALVLVAFDRATLPWHAGQLLRAGADHGGLVIFRRAVRTTDYGYQARLLTDLWEQAQASDWVNRIIYLPKTT